MHKHPTLNDLYLGNINPNESLNPDFSDFKRLNHEACELECQIKDRLSPLDKALFDAMQNARGSVSAMEVQEAFIVGFRLGANIMLEIFGTFIPNEIQG